jgi:hypothetical protein
MRASAACLAQPRGEPHGRRIEPACAGRFIFLGACIEGLGIDPNMSSWSERERYSPKTMGRIVVGRLREPACE